MKRSYKFLLYPTKEQDRNLGVMLNSHRHLYNRCLEMRSRAWDYKLSINSYDQSPWFKTERESNDYFANLNFSSAQATMRRLDKSFNSFFKRIKDNKTRKGKKKKPGYPRYKAEHRFNSFLYPKHGDGIRLTNNRLKIQNIGVVKVKLHREVVGEIKTLQIRREIDRWYVVIVCEVTIKEIQEAKEAREPNKPKKPKPTKAIGADMGLEHFLTTSEGEQINNPRFLRKAQKEIRRASRKLARAKKGSKTRIKKRKQLQQVHKNVVNQRRDFAHKTSRYFIDRYGLIAMESLSVDNMLKNHRYARSISDAAWAAFADAVEYKAEDAGIQFVKVNPRGTSQECSRCGQVVQKELSVRWHDCPFCGLSIHRDINAALNILFRALARTEPESGISILSNHLLYPEWISSFLATSGRFGSPRL